MKKIYNHISPGLSVLEQEMAGYIPEGGNWQNIPESIPSKRLKNIRSTGGRTTYYGRLIWDKPSYTITTYFNRLGNGCNLHPDQNRIMSIREGARLQSFPDNFVFKGSRTSQYKQIGNAVPPLLARAIAGAIKPYLNSLGYIDLFAGAGGMSEGFKMEGFSLQGAVEIEPNFAETYRFNHPECDPNSVLVGDITDDSIRNKIKSVTKDAPIGVVVGGPPCQGFSYAGWRNPEDERNQLFREYYDIVKDVNPEFFVMENVPGILTMRKGEVAKEIKQIFMDLGYTVSGPFKLNAEDYGVPQKRRRVFFIGSKNGIKIKSIPPLFNDNDMYLPSPITVREAIGSLPSLGLKDGKVELEIEYEPISCYDLLMGGEIDFKEFCRLCKEGERSVANIRSFV